MKLFLLTLLFFIAMNLIAQSDNIKSAEIILHYLVREPKIKTDSPPVIILLHGIGSNEEDLFSFADQLPDKFLVVSARAPYSIGHDGYAWYEANFSTPKPTFNKEQAEQSRNTIIQFIIQLNAQHPFDAKQVYLVGFSQGGIMSYSAGLTRPDMIKGIAVMSGRLLDEVKPLIAQNEKLDQLKVFIAHGTDDNVLPIQNAHEALTYLKKLNMNPIYKEYNEGHGINNEELADLIKWLNGK